MQSLKWFHKKLKLPDCKFEMEDRFPTELQETANNFHTALSDIDNTLKLLHESSLEELEAKVIVFFLYFHPREHEVKFN